jgi:hypothetical protein
MTISQSNGQNTHIKLQLSISPEEFMNDRVVYKIKVYTRLSEKYRFWYQLTSVIAIVCSTMVPVLINLGVAAIVPTILSLLVTILVSLEKLFHFREHWRNYDLMAASLRSEQVQFQTRSGTYRKKGANPEKAFQRFVENVEAGIKEERNDTIGMRTQGAG